MATDSACTKGYEYIRTSSCEVLHVQKDMTSIYVRVAAKMDGSAHAQSTKLQYTPEKILRGALRTGTVHELPMGGAVRVCFFACFLVNSVADPRHFGVDPDSDPAIFIIDFQDANKKLI